MLYSLQDALFARPFDVDTLNLSSGPVTLLQSVARANVTAEAQLGFSNNGVLAYLVGVNLTERSILWVDRDGTEELIPIAPGAYNYVRIAPDGRRVAIDDASVENPLWIWDLDSETPTRLRLGETGGDAPAWTPSGTQIAYHTGSGNIFDWRAANNTGSPERFATDPSYSGDPHPYFFVSETELVFGGRAAADTGNDIGIVSFGNDKVTWLLAGPADEENPELSPDRHWIAYQSNESGEFEIYVRPYPNVEDNVIPISNAGGVKPLWSRDGSELYYLEPGNPPQLVSVSVQTSEANFSFRDRAPVMDWSYLGLAGERRPYDIAADGRLLTITVAESQGQVGATQIAVVQNWFQELERLVPAE